jgi:hypothetical protein
LLDLLHNRCPLQLTLQSMRCDQWKLIGSDEIDGNKSHEIWRTEAIDWNERREGDDDWNGTGSFEREVPLSSSSRV